MKYTTKPKTANPVAKHAGSTTASSAGAHYQGKNQKKAAKQGDVKHKKQMDMAENFNPEYDDEAGMADNNLETLERAVQGIDELISDGDNLPEWCQEKIAVAKSMLVTVWDYMKSEEERGVAESERRMSRAAKGHEKYGYDENVTEKIKGVDGKACWKGKRYAGKVKKADGTYKDKCVPVSESNWYELRLQTLLESKIKK